ncbi:MAG: hypothetical protein OXU45_03360, partial [Candidatus Melainabacteria bacterium]|nr:hypothetical protein [Candidatus Melainabacteria bacterium]
FNKRSGDLIDLETAEFVVNSEDKLPSKTNKILPNGLITDVEPLIEWDHAVGAQSYKLILYKFDEIKKHWNRVTQAITSE